MRTSLFFVARRHRASFTAWLVLAARAFLCSTELPVVEMDSSAPADSPAVSVGDPTAVARRRRGVRAMRKADGFFFHRFKVRYNARPTIAKTLAKSFNVTPKMITDIVQQ